MFILSHNSRTELAVHTVSDLQFDGSLNRYAGIRSINAVFNAESLTVWPRLHKRACLIIYDGAQFMPRWHCCENCE